MNLTALNETYGESVVLAVGGWVIGLLFGFFAQRSKFCLRAAVVEFWHHQFGEKLSVWLLTFSAAVIAIQSLIVLGDLDVAHVAEVMHRSPNWVRVTQFRALRRLAEHFPPDSIGSVMHAHHETI